jgi:acetoin utilization protein AcuB
MRTEVKTLMTGQPVSIEPDAPALAALDLMVEHGIRHLPVVDPEARVCGVLSFDDLRAALPGAVSLRVLPTTADRQAAGGIAVGEVMTYAPLTIRYDAPLEEAAQRMAEERVGCLPVVDEEGRLDGILTETDCLHALVTMLWSERRGDSLRPAEPPSLVATLESEARALAEQLDTYERREQALTDAERDTPYDFGDRSQAREDGWLTERLADLAARRLRAIEHALERDRTGRLGQCEQCGGRIPDARLRAMPSTTLCVRCATRAETPA